MNKHQQIIQEYKDKLKRDKFSRNQVIAIEQRIKTESPQVCNKCGKTENLTLDHIVPKDMLITFGANPNIEVIEDNYQILCHMCNMFKGNKLDFSNKQTKVILLRLLEKL